MIYVRFSMSMEREEQMIERILFNILEIFAELIGSVFCYLLV